MPEKPKQQDRSPRGRSKPIEDAADLARGANGLGDADDWAAQAEPAVHMMRAGVAGAMAMSLGAAAFTLESMARMMSLGGAQRPEADTGDDIEGIGGPAAPVRRTRTPPKDKK
ncbi:hypothetical protein [Maliponia aquimaris]|uniref:Uncharacterized protein n=1 Tax=Maliponia aquimaris TaxID=1673631 RepID=A0A238K647_9RHOB|nr:hypothetical protein [Maliponia aquimaris]SMX38329.1 hypothetical protein MAA8898_01506 [Maliponia aquimaris]